MSENVNNTATEAQAEETNTVIVTEAKEHQGTHLTEEEKQEFIDRAEEETEASEELSLTKEETVMFNRLMGNYNSYEVEKTLTQSFEGVFKNTKSFVDAGNKYADEMKAFLNNSSMYNSEYIAEKKKKINDEFNSRIAAYGDMVQTKLRDIKVNLLARAQQLPLGSTEFNTAFNLINVAGKNINDNTLKQIAEQFRGDIASLRALKSTAETFSASGAAYFSELIFDPVRTVGKLQGQAIDLFGNAPSMPGMAPMITADTMMKDVGNLKYKAILFGKELEKLTELANINIMPWYTEIVKAADADDIAFLAGLNGSASGGYNNEIISGAAEETVAE